MKAGCLGALLSAGMLGLGCVLVSTHLQPSDDRIYGTAAAPNQQGGSMTHCRRKSLPACTARVSRLVRNEEICKDALWWLFFAMWLS